MQISFDLDEFIAYLLTGGLLLFGLQSITNLDIQVLAGTIFVSGTVEQNVANIVVLAALSFIAGHVSSIFARHISRNLIWLLVVRPRELPFASNIDPFWNNGLRTAITELNQRHFHDLTQGMNESEIRTVLPRLIRAKCLSESSTLVEARNRIVRARSMCANSILPLAILCAHFLHTQSYWAAMAFLGASLLMFIKQHDLDKREWKEIYSFYLAHPKGQDRNSLEQ